MSWLGTLGRVLEPGEGRKEPYAGATRSRVVVDQVEVVDRRPALVVAAYAKMPSPRLPIGGPNLCAA
eukprot:10371741-Heterocapsa_arctica.AAC.1